MPASGRFSRLCAHLVCGAAAVRRSFPDALLERIERAVAEGERAHTAELRIAIEASLPWQHVLSGLTPAERARELFVELGVWDTEGNNGLLLYLLVADQAIEIVADRAAHAALGQPALDRICHRLGTGLRQAGGKPGTGASVEAALLDAVAELNAALAEAFPAQDAAAVNELPDRPLRLPDGRGRTSFLPGRTER